MKLALPSRGKLGARAPAARKASTPQRAAPRNPTIVQWEQEAARAATAVATGAVNQARALSPAPAAATPPSGPSSP